MKGDDEPVSERWVIVHLDCGQPAFRMRRRPRRGDVLRVADIELLDGSEPVPNSWVPCGTCGTPVNPHTNLNDIWLRQEQPDGTLVPVIDAVVYGGLRYG